MKHVIETVQIIRRKYYVEVENPYWACDSIVMEELQPFSSRCMTEDILSTTQVDEFPVATAGDSVNAATYKYNYDTEEFESIVKWNLT